MSIAARELTNVARLEQYEGRGQNWTTILETELAHARKAQEGLSGLQQREIEQAVMSAFLHSQPIGQRAATRDLKVLVDADSPDKSDGQSAAHLIHGRFLPSSASPCRGCVHRRH